MVAFWIVAIVFTVAYIDVERAFHPYDMTEESRKRLPAND
jgi:hypothetical protein